eukprot:gnl/MRDRNA2_/MRDRNA2_19287_c0_seq1.p1 gnl/MRDRNA2_/MRDRNA2_19287_c0~~gnl/MRDRNA2_/MRDRNA2_19287_c0_seq1.p1  ORF type:complete len:258 (+),score=44.10 gnl/MRDRNA2_/MRDRNA2_19287_c0_seq1:73-846(+)
MEYEGALLSCQSHCIASDDDVVQDSFAASSGSCHVAPIHNLNQSSRWRSQQQSGGAIDLRHLLVLKYGSLEEALRCLNLLPNQQLSLSDFQRITRRAGFCDASQTQLLFNSCKNPCVSDDRVPLSDALALTVTGPDGKTMQQQVMQRTWSIESSSGAQQATEDHGGQQSSERQQRRIPSERPSFFGSCQDSIAEPVLDCVCTARVKDDGRATGGTGDTPESKSKTKKTIFGTTRDTVGGGYLKQNLRHTRGESGSTH